MKTDKTLLELAAKAYWGDEIDDVVSIEYSESDEGILYTHGENQDHNGIDRTYRWNPLTEDADALRLAVKLSLLILPYPIDNAVRVTPFPEHNEIVSFGSPSDPYAATRRAITRAAAAIGEKM